MNKLVRSQSPAEYFKELVEQAVARQKVSPSELSAYYLVHLLETFVRLDRVYEGAGVEKDKTLAELLCRGLAAESGARRLALFKLTGDLSLFISGFFADSLEGKLVDVDYYVRMGGYAYARASLLSDTSAAEVFSELSQKFVRFVDVLNEVSELSSLSNSRSLLRLYEKWLRTGSKRSESLLREQGVLLPPGSKRVH